MTVHRPFPLWSLTRVIWGKHSGLSDGWHPEVAGEGAVDGVEGAEAVFDGGGQVGPDGQPGGGAGLRLVAAGDLHLGLDGS